MSSSEIEAVAHRVRAIAAGTIPCASPRQWFRTDQSDYQALGELKNKLVAASGLEDIDDTGPLPLSTFFGGFIDGMLEEATKR
jgi:hypothetical protein